MTGGSRQIGEEDSPEEVTVQVISPNLSVEGAIERVDSDSEFSTDSVRIVGYPKFVLEYQCSLERLFLSDRSVSVSITVNGITGGRLRNDVYPETEGRTVSSDALLRPRLTRDDAAEKSRSVLRKYLSFHYPTYVLMSGMPETEILQEMMVYALYWLVPETERSDGSVAVAIVDSISGEVVERGIQPDQVDGTELL
jgi:hypothetical protein